MKVKRESIEKAIEAKGGKYLGARYPWRVWELHGELVRILAQEYLDENELKIVRAKLEEIECCLKKTRN